jgi:hypothetical protein
VFGRLVEFLNRPDSAGVVYRLGHTKPESVMVEIALPGWHWEVEMHDQRIDGDRALPVDRQPQVPESYRGPDAITKDI